MTHKFNFSLFTAMLVAIGCYDYTDDSGDTGAGQCSESQAFTPECSDSYDLTCDDTSFTFEPGSCYIVQLDMDGTWTAYETTHCPWAS